MGQTKKKHRGGDPNKCVFIHLGYNLSGLGNQLFVYAAGVVAKMKTGHKLCMHWSDENPHSKMDYRPMLLQGESVESDDPRIAKAFPLHQGIHQFNVWSNKNIPTNPVDYYMHGSMYHTYQPIKKALPIIRKDFKKVFSNMFPNLKFKKNSAFVHVRRGDYLRAFHDHIPPIEYYKTGIDILRKGGIKNIYLVSDDIEWSKKELDGFGLIPFEGGELETLYLMSSCKAGAVLSPSTFSGWGAMLGPDENKNAIIVYPKHWLGRSNNPHGWPSWWKETEPAT
jgi:hypothetical protein